MGKLLAVAVLMASTQAPGKPRLELSLGPNPKGANPGFTITLTMINDSPQPVETAAPLMVVPRVIGPDGKPVVFMDWRDQAGATPPQVPANPVEPLRPGKRAEIARFTVFESAGSHGIHVPFGGATLPPGKYVISIGSAFGPMTREMWVEAYAQGTRTSPGAMKRGETPESAAARAAAVHEKHWADVPTFWTGTLASNELEFTIPASKP